MGASVEERVRDMACGRNLILRDVILLLENLGRQIYQIFHFDKLFEKDALMMLFLCRDEYRKFMI